MTRCFTGKFEEKIFGAGRVGGRPTHRMKQKRDEWGTRPIRRFWLRQNDDGGQAE